MNAKLLLIVAILVVAGAIFLNLRGKEDPAAPLVAAPTASLTFPTVSPTPGSSQSVIWTEIAPSETRMDAQGTMLLLDTETGRLYSPSDRNAQDGPYTSMTWSPDGNLLVQMYPRRSDESASDTVFIGPPLGPMTAVSSTETYVSSRGIAASYESGAVAMAVITEVATERELARFPLAAGQTVGPWSPDGRYLSTRTGGSPWDGKNPLTSIWDVDTGQVVLELPAFQVSWANQHDRFTFDVIDFTRGDDSVVESRVYDMDSGGEYVINARSTVSVLWSPDDRYLVATAPNNDRAYAFSVFDAMDGGVLMTARGSWPMAWIDADTIGFMANVCTDSMPLYYVDADGSNLQKVLDVAGYGVAHPSPGGDRVAYTDYGDTPAQANVVKVYGHATGRSLEIDVGATYLWPYPWTNQRVWSPDGRFLILTSPVAKGGPCMGDEVVPFQLIRHP